jgi:hypothetical protein
MVHVVQQFDGDDPNWLVEGSADYVRWFKYEPQSHGADIVWMRRLRHFTPRYDASYRISANFLNWVTEKYDKEIVTQLNAAMRADTYDDNLWKKCTGKTVQQLGKEWKQDIEAQLGTPSVVNHVKTKGLIDNKLSSVVRHHATPRSRPGQQLVWVDIQLQFWAKAVWG